MKKHILDEYPTKAKKREIKKRPKMKLHSASLRRTSPHAGKKIISK